MLECASSIVTMHLTVCARCLPNNVNKNSSLTPPIKNDAKHVAEGAGVIPPARDASTSDQIPWQLFVIVAGGFVGLTLISLGIVMIFMRYFDD